MSRCCSCARNRYPPPQTEGAAPFYAAVLANLGALYYKMSRMEDLAQQGRLWQIEANGRVHATTGSRPQDLWQRENLTPLSGLAPYVLTQRHPRRVEVEG